MFPPPKSRQQNEHNTREFTARLARFCAEQLGAEVEPVEMSGNAGPDDDAFLFTAEIDKQLFHVEVFGPFWEEA